MKKVICGNEEGYLIPKKEFEEKLKQRFEVLKGQQIVSVGALVSNEVTVHYYDENLLKKEKEGFTLPGEVRYNRLFFDNKILNEIFKLKEGFNRIEAKEEFKKGKFHNIYLGEAVVDQSNIYYFLNTREEPFYDVMSELA